MAARMTGAPGDARSPAGSAWDVAGRPAPARARDTARTACATPPLPPSGPARRPGSSAGPPRRRHARWRSAARRQAVRIGEHLGVAVGAGEHGGDHGAGRHPDTGDRGVADAGAAGHQDGRVEPQHLVDGVRPEVRTLTQHVELVGVGSEQGDAVAQQVHGRLEPGGQDEPRCRLELGVVETPAVLAASRDEPAEQVVTGVLPHPLDMALEPRVEVTQGGLDISEASPGQAEVQAGRRGCAVLEDLGALGVRHSQDLGDHRDGQQAAVALDEVDGVLPRQLGEQLVGDLLGAGPELRDGADREHPVDQLAVAGVVRRLGHQQRRRTQRTQRGGLVAPPAQPRQRTVTGGLEARTEVVAGQHLLDHGMAGRGEGVPAPVERAAGPERLDGRDQGVAVVASRGDEETPVEVTAAPGGPDDSLGQGVPQPPPHS